MQGNANVILVNARGCENRCVNDEIFLKMLLYNCLKLDVVD